MMPGGLIIHFFSWRSIPHWYLHVLASLQRCYPAPEDKNKKEIPELSDEQVVSWSNLSQILSQFVSHRNWRQIKSQNRKSRGSSMFVMRNCFSWTVWNSGRSQAMFCDGANFKRNTAWVAAQEKLEFGAVHRVLCWIHLQVQLYKSLNWIPDSRVFFLLPTRILLLVTSFVFVALAGFQTAVRVISCTSRSDEMCRFQKLSDHEKTWVAIVYCRLFCGSMGLVANYRNPQNRPKKPGKRKSKWKLSNIRQTKIS